ncbi:MAG: hypothetical protein WC901_05550 [Candidatus Margulisiibacteriota bacterium]
MQDFHCPICASPIKVTEPLKAGVRFVCENCYAELALHKFRNGYFLGCPFCKESVFDPNNCAACERRQEKVAKFNLDRFIKL